MWFRNLLVYRLTQDLQLDADSLEKALGEKPARPCASQELTTYGFTAPFGKGPDAPLVHVSQDFFLISARKEERILPGSVVRDALKEKVDEIADEEHVRVLGHGLGDLGPERGELGLGFGALDLAELARDDHGLAADVDAGGFLLLLTRHDVLTGLSALAAAPSHQARRGRE